MTVFLRTLARAIRRPLGVAAVAALVPAAGFAQAPGATDTTPPPPQTPATETRRADLRVTLNGAYDWTDVDDPLVPLGDGGGDEAAFAAAGAVLTFSSLGRGVAFSATAATNQRRFQHSASFLNSDYFGRVSVAAPLGRRVSAAASQRISYSPFYSLVSPQGTDLSPDDVLQPDYGVVRSDTFTAGSAAGLTWILGPRTSMTAGYAADLVDTLAAAQGYFSQGASASLARRLTPYATLTAGYAYRQTQLSVGDFRYGFHDLLGGFTYTRPLSSSRRTYVSFNTGAALVAYSGRYLVFTGAAALTHQMSRTWATALSYSRGVYTYAGLAQPYVANTAAGTLTGTLTPKLALSLAGGYTEGRVARRAADDGFGTLYGRARLQLSQIRFVPLFGEYLIYRTRFERPFGPDLSFPLYIRRQGVRVGLAYSMPLGRNR